MRTKTHRESFFKGIGVSPGIFIGKVTLIERPDIKVSGRRLQSDEAVEAEIEKFIAARDLFVHELESSLASLPESVRTVVQTQITILKDASLERKVIDIIRSERRPAEYAIKKVLHIFAGEIERSGTEYMKERAAEIRGIASDLILRVQDSTAPRGRKIMLRNRAIIAYDLSVQETLRAIKGGAKAFAFAYGGKTSHAGIIIRNYHLPAVFALGDEFIDSINGGDRIIVDGYSGVVILHPKEATILNYRDLRARYQLQEKKLLELKKVPAMTTDQVRFTILANIDLPEELDLVKSYGAQGVGLFRTEHLFENYKLDETSQTRIYSRVARKVYPGPLVIRLFDLGADKVFGGQMRNPGLGLRGVRVLLRDENLLRTQIRAILKANKLGNVKLMIPMVSLVEEIELVKEILKQEYRKLKLNSIYRSLQLPELGLMVETPSVAVMSDKFAEHVEFFSIGTNDLTQYMLAVARGDAELSSIYDHLHPAVIRMIKTVSENAHKKNVWVGVCGELASDQLGIPLLVGMNVDELSVAPGTILSVKNIINHIPYSKARELVDEVIQMESAQEVKEAVRNFLKEFLSEPAIDDENAE